MDPNPSRLLGGRVRGMRLRVPGQPGRLVPALRSGLVTEPAPPCLIVRCRIHWTMTARREDTDMIELERDESQDIQVWADVDFRHVIVEETPDTFRHGSGPGWYVRDEDSERGPFRTLADALHFAGDVDVWGDVTLAPANRLRAEIEEGRSGEIGDFLLMYLAEYGTAGIDAQALAQRVSERIEED